MVKRKWDLRNLKINAGNKTCSGVSVALNIPYPLAGLPVVVEHKYLEQDLVISEGV